VAVVMVAVVMGGASGEARSGPGSICRAPRYLARAGYWAVQI